MKKFWIILFLLITLVLSTDMLAQGGEVLEEKNPVDALFAMVEFERPAFPDQTFNIRDYGVRIFVVADDLSELVLGEVS